MICASFCLASCDFGGEVCFRNEQKDTVYVSMKLNDTTVQVENRGQYHAVGRNGSRYAYMLPPDSALVFFGWVNGLDSSMLPFDAVLISDKHNNTLLKLTNRKDIFDHLKLHDGTYLLKL